MSIRTAVVLRHGADVFLDLLQRLHFGCHTQEGRDGTGEWVCEQNTVYLLPFTGLGVAVAAYVGGVAFVALWWSTAWARRPKHQSSPTPTPS